MSISHQILRAFLQWIQTHHLQLHHQMLKRPAHFFKKSRTWFVFLSIYFRQDLYGFNFLFVLNDLFDNLFIVLREHLPLSIWRRDRWGRNLDWDLKTNSSLSTLLLLSESARNPISKSGLAGETFLTPKSDLSSGQICHTTKRCCSKSNRLVGF